MANPAPAASPEDAKAAEAKSSQELRNSLLRDLASLPHAAHGHPNIIGQHYEVQVNRPLPELDTALCKAYEVIDTRDTNVSLYGLVCSNHLPLRSKMVKALHGVPIPGMVMLHAYGVADLTGFTGRRMVLVYDRPKGKSLAQALAARQKPLSEDFITQHIVRPLGLAVHTLAEMGLTHGRINLNNMFISDTLTLGECISEPCGYSQPYMFEVPERAQCSPAGKGETLPENDIFTIGMLVAYLRLGPKHFQRAQTVESYINWLLKGGAYAGVVGTLELSDGMSDILRGTLNDKPDERWTWEQLRLWCKGRRYNMLPPNSPGTATRPFVLDQQEYENLRTASHGIFKHWDTFTNTLADGQLLRWLELSARRKDIADTVRRAIQSLSVLSGGRTAQQNNELIARIITLLDPQAPLSMRDVRVHVTGLGPMIADCYHKNAQATLQHCFDMIEYSLPTVWADTYRRRDEDPPGNVNDILWQIDRMRTLIRIPGYGFGLTRALYDLNQELPCQSPLLGENYAGSLKDLLLALDRMAADKAREGAPLDVHIAGFIASKLMLSRESVLSEYKNVPKFAHHKTFVCLRMMEQAQSSLQSLTLPGLTHWLALELLETIELFHSKSIRAQLQAGIQQIAAHGKVSMLSNFVNQRVFALGDSEGYHMAIRAYVETNMEIARLRDRWHRKKSAAISGHSVAKYIANVVLIIVMLFVFHDFLFM